MSLLTWLERDRFLDVANSQLPCLRAWQHFGFEIDPCGIYAELPTQYFENPPEDSFPAPVRRWYGRLYDRLFTVDVDPLWSPNACQIQIPYSDFHDFAWQTLLDLQILPSAIHADRIPFISNDAATPVLTVYLRNERGYDSPIYDGASEEDATSLFQYLRERVPDADFSLAEPEAKIAWVAVEMSGRAGIVRACYPSKSSTLSTGCDMSSKSEHTFQVYSESPEIDDRRYLIRNGKVIS